MNNRPAHSTMTRWLALLLLLPFAASAEPVRDKYVEADLIAEPTAVQPGHPFWVAVRLTMDDEWHTYWKNPGDSGFGTKIEWKLPDGFTAGPIQWPYPHRIELGGLVSYGYEKEVLLLTEITPPADLEATGVTLRAHVEWLMCKELCIPGRVNLEQSLPVAADAEADPRWIDAFAATRAALPAVTDAWTFAARYDDKTIELRAIAGRGAAAVPRTAYFYPSSTDLIDHARPQAVQVKGGELTLFMTRSEITPDITNRLEGVLVGEAGWLAHGDARALAVDTAIEAAPGALSPPPGSTQATGGAAMTVPVAIAFALLGGLILNLMPCVFPVISLKVLGFVQQAGESRGRLFEHGAVFAAGVLVSFAALAGALLALRAGGAEIGWGFQLQSPRIVVLLASMFFLLGLSLFGVFEIGLSLTGAGGALQARGGLVGSFFSGLLATIVATPCTAPFMGAALGYALSLPTALAMSVFLALGLGMALPYVVLAASPGLIRRIPRPGPWMESIKEFMGFLMMATVVWLLWVLGIQAGLEAVIAMAGAFVILGLAAWIAGRWGALQRRTAVRVVAHVLAAALVAGGVALAWRSARTQTVHEARTVTTAGGVTWEPYSAERVEELRAEGRPVFIDFTAAWCLTCQVNKRVALHNADVEARLKELGVATLKADWTDRDDTIERALASYGRSGVPVYVLYGNHSAQPKLLPEILTPRIVLDALDEIR